MDLIVNGSDTAIFNITVLVRESVNEFTYQWQKNGSNLVEIPGKVEGVNSTKLVIREARNEDEGGYWCVITNKVGDMVMTNEAFLIVGKNQQFIMYYNHAVLYVILMTLICNTLVDLPAVPLITNVSAGSTYITITWERDLSGALHWYELEYTFTIRDCKYYTGEGNEVISNHLSNYTLRNSSETPVEEDSAYSIFLVAVNSDGRSEASVTEISTLKNGKLL
jgi:hypothetical protein